MKRIIVLAALVVAALSMSAVAFASSGPILGGSNSGIGTSQGGHNNTTTQYRATYIDPFFGPVTCIGVHQTGKTGTATAGGQDSFTCTSTSGSPLTNVTPSETISLTTISGWISDYYFLLNGSSVYATSFAGTVSADGMSYTAVATY
jgi:hypothetical protein